MSEDEDSSSHHKSDFSYLNPDDSYYTNLNKVVTKDVKKSKHLIAEWDFTSFKFDPSHPQYTKLISLQNIQKKLIAQGETHVYLLYVLTLIML